MIKGLIHRAHVLCDLKKDLLEELSLFNDAFLSIGQYPENLKEYHDFFCAPYPEQLVRKLRRQKVGYVHKKKREPLYMNLCSN